MLSVTLMLVLRFMFAAAMLSIGSSWPSHLNLEKYFNTEQKLLETFDALTESAESEIAVFERELSQLLGEIPPVESSNHYLGHPLNVLSMVRRLFKQWTKLVSLLSQQAEYMTIRLSFTKLMASFSNARQYMAQTVVKLQNIYQLNTTSLAEGFIDQRKTYTDISAEDCFIIAKQYYHKTLQFKEAEFWLRQALVKIFNFDDETADGKKVYEYLFLARCFLGDQESSRSAYNKLLELFPSFQPSDSLTDDYQLALGGCREAARVKTEASKNVSLRFGVKEAEDISDPVCRGQVEPVAGLSCRYLHYNLSHLLIGPFKMEEMYIDPPVVLIHNFISDAEIESILESSRPYYHRSFLEKGELSHIRQSESSGLWSNTEVELRLRRRISSASGLNLKLSEYGQVTAYGPGGEYVMHHDHLDEDFYVVRGIKSNRLATFMIYLLDVEKGGHTGFPDLKISVAPVKGTAVFWYNTYTNGQEDDLLVHNACPVAVGRKIVVTQWIAKSGNEFRQPCRPSQQSSFKHFYL